MGLRHRMARGVLTAALATGLVLSQGCSAFQPRTQSVLIQSTVPGAEVSVNGMVVGTAPLTVQLERNRTQQIVARSGTQVGVATIGRSISTTGVLDIIGTFFFIVPVIGVFTPGFWQLDQTGVTVVVR